MNIKKISIISSTAIIISITLSFMSLWKVYNIYNVVNIAQENRKYAMNIVNDLQMQIIQLNKLVRTYIATAEPKYLIYYYDLLAIQQGTKPAPSEYKSSLYWDFVVAQKIEHKMPTTGKGISIADKMKQQGFSFEELKIWNEILLATKQINQIEQIAFAATQGLYDSKKGVFVEDENPDMDFASKLIYDKEYLSLNALLTELIDKLIVTTDNRTKQMVVEAELALSKWGLFSLIFAILIIFMVVVSLITVRKLLLIPIDNLTFATKNIALGNYSFRVNSSKWLDELKHLAITLNKMAQDISRDIENREKNRIELEEAKKMAESATKAKSMFLANMSHEIRTPMNAIIGMSYLALQTNLDTKQREFIEHVNFAGNSLLGIINDILDFSKIEAGKISLENIPFDLKKLLENIFNTHQFRAKEKNLELIFDTFNIFEDKKIVLIGDELRLTQIVNNLLSNAIKFTNSGFVKLSLNLKRDTNNENRVFIEMNVTDSGIGMSEEQVSRLFQEFTQADSSTTRKYGGTGLGLAISKNLAEIMGGTLSLESHEKEGTTFKLLIPFEIAHEDIVLHENIEQISDTTEYQKTLKGLKILLAEDNPLNQTLAIELLKSKGVEVYLANNGKEAIDLLTSKPNYFDVVLMDLQMPILDGYEATIEIKKSALYKDLPIIAMTAHVMNDEIAKCKEIGIQEYISKPIKPDLLYNILLKYSKNRLENIETAPTKISYIDKICVKDLNTKDGLMYAGLNEKVYIDLLNSFVLNYENIHEKIKNLLLEDNLKQAKMKIHSIKGLLGTIGARRLYDIAKELEISCSTNQNIEKSLEEFSKNFQPFIKDLKNELQNIQYDNICHDNKDDIIWLDEFKKELEISSFEAIDRWNEHKNSLQKIVDEESFSKISKSILNFDFEEVLKILNEVKI